MNKISSELILRLAELEGTSAVFREVLKEYCANIHRADAVRIDLDASIISAFKTGGIVAGVKMHRSLVAGVGLAESKAYVEKVTANVPR